MTESVGIACLSLCVVAGVVCEGGEIVCRHCQVAPQDYKAEVEEVFHSSQGGS